MATQMGGPPMNVTRGPPAPPQEYETYLDKNTGHQRLKGGALLIRDPTEQELAECGMNDEEQMWLDMQMQTASAKSASQPGLSAEEEKWIHANMN